MKIKANLMRVKEAYTAHQFYLHYSKLHNTTYIFVDEREITFISFRCFQRTHSDLMGLMASTKISLALDVF